MENTMSLYSLDWELKQEPLWKQEPCSPSYVTLDGNDECWLPNDDLANTQEEPFHQKPLSRGEVAAKLLEDLEDLTEWIKCEPFNNWLEEKTDLPILEDLPVEQPRDTFYGVRAPLHEAVKQQSLVADASHISKEVLQPSLSAPVSQTETLLQEFESAFREVELNNGTLTPPQSPTIANSVTHYSPTDSVVSNDAFLISEPHILPIHATAVPVNVTAVGPFIEVISEKKDTFFTNLEQMVPSTPAPDIAKELADVDELVRSRAEDMEVSSNAWQDVNCRFTSDSKDGYEPHVLPLSPSTSSNSSFESSEESADDPEWVPAAEQLSSPGPQKSSGRKRGSSSKPYARPGVEEKKLRKKEQNKNAATRYRQKKKAEIEEILSEERALEQKNSELTQKITDLSREIKYLKGLMRDVFRAKGLIK
ncbi:activating transcription factor of chaperone isoform X1 [Schistocerca serialis cubense]|uniref:activating transcription factor of chaperone isoform X1 n=1 Tax=Schistocerca serialis cubense TaxID=2023355 RepID=UPI00214ED9F9|nr:activating transcription factor of chaperone isoform X1 [Schistocerca serialis cubense]